jgi:hypothetical protein
MYIVHTVTAEQTIELELCYLLAISYIMYMEKYTFLALYIIHEVGCLRV